MANVVTSGAEKRERTGETDNVTEGKGGRKEERKDIHDGFFFFVFEGGINSAIRLTASLTACLNDRSFLLCSHFTLMIRLINQ
jgi:hypothetical protein